MARTHPSAFRCRAVATLSSRTLGGQPWLRHRAKMESVLIGMRRAISELERAIDRVVDSGKPFLRRSMSTQHPVVRFGTFELDSRSGELRRDGRRVPLQGQPAQVLCQLVSHPGELVSREELRRAIWAGDTFVDFDTALKIAINK